jgi:hypothetical protein
MSVWLYLCLSLYLWRGESRHARTAQSASRHTLRLCTGLGRGDRTPESGRASAKVMACTPGDEKRPGQRGRPKLYVAAPRPPLGVFMTLRRTNKLTERHANAIARAIRPHARAPQATLSVVDSARVPRVRRARVALSRPAPRERDGAPPPRSSRLSVLSKGPALSVAHVEHAQTREL